MRNSHQRQSVIELKRKQRIGFRRLIAVLGSMVVLVTAFALMVPALSVTQESAQQEGGFYLDGARSAAVGEGAADGGAADGSGADNAIAGGPINDAGATDNGNATADDASPYAEDADEATADGGEDPDANAEMADEEANEDADSEDEASDDEGHEPAMPEQFFAAELRNPDGQLVVGVEVEAPEGALPEGVTMSLVEVTNDKVISATKQKGADELRDAALAAGKPAEEADASAQQAKVVPLAMKFADADGNEVKPVQDVRLTMNVPAVGSVGSDDELAVVAMDDKTVEKAGGVKEPETAEPASALDAAMKEAAAQEFAAKVADDVSVVAPDDLDVDRDAQRLSFDADDSQVFAVVYTVDFHWDVNGQQYDFSIPGGGYISFSKLVEVLRIADSANDMDSENSETQETRTLTLADIEASEATKEFVADVASITFSSSDLLSVSKVEESTTVGAIKEDFGLECEYSAELTEEQIEEINAQPIGAGDWALISLRPFTSEEILTVTMKTGEVFTIKISDSQDPYGLDGQSFEMIVNGNKALNPVSETENIGGVSYQFLNNADPESGSNLAWQFEYDHDAFGENISGYYISHDGQYLKIVGDDSSDPNRTVTLVGSKAEATPIAVKYDKGKGKYSFSNKADSSNGFLCQFNNDYFGVDGNSNDDNAWFELRDPDHPEKPGLVSPWDVKGDNIRIKLFDYSGTVNGGDIDDSAGDYYDATTWHSGDGINNGRTLIFSGGGLVSKSDGQWNYYTGQQPAVMQGIVKNTLTSGYPELTNTTGNEGASLGYLFGAGGQDGVTAYTGTDGNGLKGLLRRDENGYYYFSSEQNYATLVNPETGQIVNDEIHLYSESYKKDNASVNASKIGFFPFDPYRAGETKAGEEKGFNGSPYNHQFGMTLEADFALPPNGKLPNGEDMVFEFSGDDDVWVFIDDVLVLDLGGVHQPLSGKIDFADGKSYVTDATIQTVTGQTNTVGNGRTIKELFEAAGKTYDDSAYSTHTIKFFYLERGGCDSNCTLSFNLDVVKGKGSVDVAKYDQDAQPVAPLKGVKFGLYSDPGCTELMKEITSDGNGIVSFKDLPVKTDDQKYYLKETKELAGYQKDTTIYTLEAVKIETGKYYFKVMKDGQEIGTIGQNPQYPVIYNEQIEPIDLSVEKKWQDTNGNTINPPSDASAKFKVQRYFRTEGEIEKPDPSQPVTLKVYRYKDGQTPEQEGSDYTNLKGGSTFKVNWGYSGGYLNYDYDNRHNTYRYNSTSGGYSVKDGDGPLELTLPESGTANLYIRDENVGTQWGAGVINVNVTGTTQYEQSTIIEPVSTDWDKDDEYNNAGNCPTLTLPENDSDPWIGKFSNLKTAETRADGLSYYYKYYIIETDKTPTSAQIVYVDGNNQPVQDNDASSLQTNENGKTQTIINKVPIGNLKITKDLLGDVTGNEDKQFKVTIKNSSTPAQYLQEDKKTFGNTRYEFAVSKNTALEITDLPIGTYIVEEVTNPDDVSITGYLWNIEESSTGGTATVVANQTTAVELKNYYDEVYTPTPSDMDVTENLEIKKAWENHTETNEDEIQVKIKVKSEEAYVPVRWNLYDANANLNSLSNVWYVEPGSDVGFTVSRKDNVGTDFKRIRLNSNVTLWSENGSALQLNNRVPRTDQQNYYAPNAASFTYTARDISAANPVEYLLQPVHNGSTWVDGTPSEQGKWNMSVNVEAGKDYYTSLTAMRDALINENTTSETLVYSMKNGSDPQLVDSLTTCNIRPKSVSGTGWDITLNDLPTYMRISTTAGNQTTYSYKVYKYEVEEIRVNGQPVTNGKTDDFQVGYTSSSNTDGDGKVTTTTDITNSELSTSIQLLKTDDQENSINYLPGAKFELLHRNKTEDSWEKVSKTVVNELDEQSQFTIPGNENGITLTGLKSGFYKLVEIEAPAGYVISETPVEFEVRRGEIVGHTVSGNTVVTLKIPNTPGSELPHTGGSGTVAFTLFGITLICLASAGLLMKRRRQNAA